LGIAGEGSIRIFKRTWRSQDPEITGEPAFDPPETKLKQKLNMP
jgi:hypothetical protein